MARSIFGSLILTTGKMGDGKSYSRCGRAIPEYFADGVTYHISNMPVRFEDNKDGEGMASACRRLVRLPDDWDDPTGPTHAMEEDECRDRIRFIPDDVFNSWRVHTPHSTDAGDGPWNYFADMDLSGAHIAIDEFQLLCPEQGAQAAKKAKWADWITHIRHAGATLEIITQNPTLIANQVRSLVNVQIQIFSRDNDPVPWMGCRFGTLRQFYCKWRKKQWMMCAEIELVSEAAGKFQEVARRPFTIDGKLWGRYDSFNKPSYCRAGKTRPEPWKRCTWLGLWANFFREAWWDQCRNAAIVAIAVWLAAFGGVSTVGGFLNHELGWLLTAVQKTKGGDEAPKEDPKKTESPKPAAVGVAGAPAPAGVSALAMAAQQGSEGLVLVALMPDVAYFKDVGWFNVGEVIGDDELNGPRLETIDWQRCRVVLSDDRVLRLPSASGSTATGGISSGVLSGDPAGAALLSGQRSAGAASDSQLQQPSAGGPGALAGQAVRRDNRLQRAGAASIGNDRRQAAAATGSAPPRGSSGGNSSEPARDGVLRR